MRQIYLKKKWPRSQPQVLTQINHIRGVMVSVLATSAVDRGFKSWSGQTKDYKIGKILRFACSFNE